MAVWKNGLALFAILFAGLILQHGAAIADSPPTDGWATNRDGKMLVLSRLYGDLELGIRVSPWLDSGNDSVELWLTTHKSQRSNGVKVVSQNHTVKKSRIPHVYYVLRQLRDKGSQSRLSLLGACSREDGMIRTVDIFGAEPFFNNTIPDALPDSLKIMAYYCTLDDASQPALATDQTDIPLDPIAPATAPANFKELRGYIYYGLQAGGMFGPTNGVIALFNDGTYSDDLATIFETGVDASRRENPKRGGDWRISGGELELKEPDENSFETTLGDWVVVAGEPEQRLAGCFGKLTSNDGMGIGTVMVGSASSWCFYPNGRFTHESTGFAIASGGGVRGAVASTPPEKRGRYHISGYAMHLIYDDGSDVVAAFGFLNDDRTHIAINGRRFMGSDKAD